MTSEKNTTIITKEPSFESVLDTTCDRLREKHAEHSIKRINELNEELSKIEEELADFLNQKQK